MKILLLSQWCLPEPDVRIYSLASTLVSRGHQVTILTGFPNYPNGRIYPGYRQHLWQREQKDGIQIIRLPLYPDHSRSVIRRTLTYLSFAVSATLLGPFLCGRPDVMWVYHPPLTTGIPALWISFWCRIPFIYEIQDMWPETVEASGMLAHRWPIHLLHRIAKFLYRHAAAITVISPGFKTNLTTKGVPAEKISVIPNWADETIYRPVPRDPTFGEQYNLLNQFNVIFAGTMGPAQALHNVLAAAAIVRNVPNLQFVFIGDGIDLPELKERAENQQLTNVCFIERQPPDRMPHFFAWADALLVQLRSDPLFHMTIPSKTLAYMACGRPILCAVPGDGADIIRQAGAGLVCPPDDPGALAEIVRQLFDMPEYKRTLMGHAGRQTFVEGYTRQILVDRYEVLFQKVSHNRMTGE